jgi:hypothetical protein
MADSFETNNNNSNNNINESNKDFNSLLSTNSANINTIKTTDTIIISKQDSLIVKNFVDQKDNFSVGAGTLNHVSSLVNPICSESIVEAAAQSDRPHHIDSEDKSRCKYLYTHPNMGPQAPLTPALPKFGFLNSYHQQTVASDWPNSHENFLVNPNQIQNHHHQPYIQSSDSSNNLINYSDFVPNKNYDSSYYINSNNASFSSSSYQQSTNHQYQPNYSYLPINTATSNSTNKLVYPATKSVANSLYSNPIDYNNYPNSSFNSSPIIAGPNQAQTTQFVGPQNTSYPTSNHQFMSDDLYFNQEKSFYDFKQPVFANSHPNNCITTVNSIGDANPSFGTVKEPEASTPIGASIKAKKRFLKSSTDSSEQDENEELEEDEDDDDSDSFSDQESSDDSDELDNENSGK